MEGHIELGRLTLEELSGISGIYPWFACARRELYGRMAAVGGLDARQYTEAAMYIGDMKILTRLLRQASDPDYSDNDVAELLRRSRGRRELEAAAEVSAPASRPGAPRPAGGDYFSQADYSQVTNAEDEVFSHYKIGTPGGGHDKGAEPDDLQVYTETLARIYADQGYFAQAVRIYSKLLLAYPEKSAYFAALIDELNENINK